MIINDVIISNGLDYIFIRINQRMQCTSAGADFRRTPLPDSRYTFQLFDPYKAAGG